MGRGDGAIAGNTATIRGAEWCVSQEVPLSDLRLNPIADIDVSKGAASAPSPSHTIATTGLEVMKSTRLAKKERKNFS